MQDILTPKKYPVTENHPAWNEHAEGEWYKGVDRDKPFIDTSYNGVLTAYKNAHKILNSWKDNILSHVKDIEDIYEHQWFCRIAGILLEK